MKYIICLLLFVSWQPIPKWKWTVHYQQFHGSTGLGMETMKSHTKYHPSTFTNSKQAWAFFWDRIRERDYRYKMDSLKQGGEPKIVRQVWIDSAEIK